VLHGQLVRVVGLLRPEDHALHRLGRGVLRIERGLQRWLVRGVRRRGPSLLCGQHVHGRGVGLWDGWHVRGLRRERTSVLRRQRVHGPWLLRHDAGDVRRQWDSVLR
jgi:hypothetical protein